MPADQTAHPIIELTFEGCVQDAEEYGSNREWMVSRVFFWIKREGGPPGNFRQDLERVSSRHFAKSRIEPPDGYTGPILYAEVRQPVGDDFVTGRIEVGPPVGYDGPFNQPVFARETAAYFRGATSDSGAMVRLEDGRPVKGGPRETSHVRLRDNAEPTRRTVRFEAAG
ncbi:MAG: hypothetical protein ACM3SU_18795 [Acidobacteriota bacterium]